MSLWQRVFAYLARNKIRSLLLFCLIFVLSNAMIASFAIHRATLNVERSIRYQLGPVVKMAYDYTKSLSADDLQTVSLPDDYEPLTVEKIHTLGRSAYVKSYDYSTGLRLGSDTLKYLPDPSEETTPYFENERQHFGFSVQGTQAPGVMLIEQGRAKLIAGRLFTPEEIEQGAPVVLMVKELAEYNQVEVDDTVVLINHVAPIPMVEYIEDSHELPVRIIGLYENIEPPSAYHQVYGSQTTDQSMYNRLIIPNAFVEPEAEYAAGDQTLAVTPPTFVLHDPKDMPRFMAESEPLLPTNYYLLSNHSIFSDIEAPVQSIISMANQVLWFSIAATIVIVTLVTLLALRDRRHEIGIYLSLGLSRPKIIKQMVLEIAIVAVVAIALSTFSGQLMAQAISDAMVQDQLIADIDYSQEQQFWDDRQAMGSYRVDLTTQDVAEVYDISFSASNILWYFLLGIGTVVVSTILPGLVLLRLSPKKVLMTSSA